MPSFSFVHMADLHLDSPFAALAGDNPALAASMRSATFEAFENVIQLCIDKGVDLLLVAGDVYDGADRSLRAQVTFRDGLKRLHEAGIRSFVAYGNHDPLNLWATSIEWPPGVHLFGDHLETVSVERDGVPLVFIQGISYPERDERRNLSRLFKRTDSAFHIGLLHANVGSDTGHEPYAPCSLEDLLRPEMDYWALGHVHRRKELSRELPFIIYPGNTQGRNIRETGKKGCYLVHVNEDKEVETEFYTTDVIRWVTREISIKGMHTLQELLDALGRITLDISKTESERTAIARILLSGSGPLFRTLRDPNTLLDLMEVARETGISYSPSVWVEQIVLRISPEFDSVDLMKGHDFIGELLRYSDELSKDRNLEELVKEDLSSLLDDYRTRRFIDLPDGRRLRDLLKEAEMICLQKLQGEETE